MAEDAPEFPDVTDEEMGKKDLMSGEEPECKEQ